ncbi:hypothetical protein [Pseudomonas rhizoryzae]|uniref:hypothetical protein n=1 Tax=Pseudomonas rhizoryzae TaxID=2571129 RepID=UPI0007368A17|nr:hypothetical protein [Pseudomonas rhizoryzae]KTS94400.1 hypothetical protein NS376_20885 [Pseudomonas psychrotolerans]KTT38137.1 hypothetical protein SB5_18725 [Pseudomonas psychrotolerans]KTT48188.1 hypothetical protein SB11R_17040 [Pseudomonas psychrotolerans]
MPQEFQELFDFIDQLLAWSDFYLKCALLLGGVGMVAGAVAWRRWWGKALAFGSAGLGVLAALGLDLLGRL